MRNVWISAVIKSMNERFIKNNKLICLDVKSKKCMIKLVLLITCNIRNRLSTQLG